MTDLEKAISDLIAAVHSRRSLGRRERIVAATDALERALEMKRRAEHSLVRRMTRRIFGRRDER